MSLKSSQTQDEQIKILAERVNGLAASIGCLAMVGAYLTAGPIIPGIV